MQLASLEGENHIMETTRKKHSIHIGIDHYEDHAIRDLQFCSADARLLASFFQDVSGYDSVSVIADPTRNAILDAVSGEIAQLNPGDLLVISYSGHGFRTEDKFLLSAADSRMPFIQEGVDGVPLEMLMKAVRERGCDCAFFIDACSRPGLGAREISVPKLPLESPQRDLILHADMDGPWCCVMRPEIPMEVAALGHGLFAAALDRALREAHGLGKSSIDAVYALVMAHAKAICQDNGMRCPSIEMSCSGPSVRLW